MNGPLIPVSGDDNLPHNAGGRSGYPLTQGENQARGLISPQGGHGGYTAGVNEHAGYPQPTGGYAPQPAGFKEQDGHPPQGAYSNPNAAGGYAPHPAALKEQEAYQPQGGYPPQVGFSPQGGYPPQGAYLPPTADHTQAAYPPKMEYYPPPAGDPTLLPGSSQPPPGTLPYGELKDLESQVFNTFTFDDESIRKGFIRKVYLILMAQLLVTFGFVALFIYHKETKLWVYRNVWSFWTAFGLFIGTVIFMSVCKDARRKTPTNFVFLGVFTIACSFLTGISAARYNSETVMIAVGTTAAVCLTLSIFAMQTKYDFTMCGGVLLVALVIFLVFGIIGAIFPGKINQLLYSSIGALLFSVYLIYDTQLMMGGNHKFSISPEEYIFAALNLYLDIINIFLYILRIVGSRN